MKKNINLLPPEEQKQITFDGYNARIQSFGLKLVLSIVAMILVLFLVKVSLSQKFDNTKSALEVKSAELKNLQGNELQKQVAALNKDIDNLDKLNSQTFKWSPYLIEFARVLPADVSIDSISISRETKKFEVSGRARSRESVLKLRENLLATDYFQSVNFPLYNLETKNNVNWKYRFYAKTKKSK